MTRPSTAQTAARVLKTVPYSRRLRCKKLDAAFGFVGDEPQLVSDLDKLRWRVLAAGDDVDLRVHVTERQQLTRALDVLEYTRGERRSEKFGGPGKPGQRGRPARIERDRFVARIDFGAAAAQRARSNFIDRRRSTHDAATW